MMLDQIMDDALRPAMALLPARMNTPAADCMLLAIGLQESRFVHRRQIGGPSRDHLATLCKARSVAGDPDAIYAALEYDDVLAAGVARLLLWTDPKALPPVGDTQAAWALYLRTWRPGKPKPDSWGGLYQQAVTAIRTRTDRSMAHVATVD